MQRQIVQALGAFAAFVTISGPVAAQQGNSDWDPVPRDLGRPPSAPGAARNTSLDALNKILSASQLSAFDRSIYLSIRAFQLSRLGREADSQKDVAEMGKLLPKAWQVVLSSTQPDLAGSGDRAAALRTLDYGLKRKPGDPWLVIAQAQVHMQIGEFALSLGMLDGAVANATGQADLRSSHYWRGHANFNLGNFAAAADDFDSAL
ncbi:MAG: hypothetical protein ACHQK9_19650, partial [Reyranellales bacterium]